MTGEPSATSISPSDIAAASLAAQSDQQEQPGCIHRWFEQQAEARPDAIAVTMDSDQLTYGQLNLRANQLAHRLIKAGVRPNVCVGLCLDRCPDLIVGLLAILKAGGAYVPLDPSYPADRLAHMVDQAKPPVVVTREALRHGLPVASASFLYIDHEIEGIDADAPKNPNTDVGPENLCYVIFTSGSTGVPKGVMVTHNNVVRLFRTIRSRMDFSTEDVWTLFHSCAFGFSAWEIFGPLLSGAELVIVPDEVRTDPEGLYQLLRQKKVTIFSQTPSAFRQLLLHDAFADANTELSLRTIVFSGEAVLQQDLLDWYQRHGDAGPTLVNTYAITETGGQVAFKAYQRDEVESTGAGTIGTPLDDTPVYILDDKQQKVPEGESGELCVGGPGVARGYLNQRHLTAERFIHVTLNGGTPRRIYRTGDQARMLPGGEIEFLGRTDGLIKLRGYRIELGEIESALRQHREVQDAAAVVRYDSITEPRLVAYVVPHFSPKQTITSRVSIPDLRAHLSEQLPDYMLPASYVLLPNLPLNANGKLERNALPIPSRERPPLGVEFTPGRTPLEQDLIKVWSEVLGLDRVGVHDNFFELGGDSILALKLTDRLRQELKDYIYMVALIEAPSIAELAEYLIENHPNAISARYPAETAQTASQPLLCHLPGSETLPLVIPDDEHHHDEFPLTDIQQAYLVGRGDDFALGNVSTHLYIEIDGYGLNLERLETAWRRVIDRHPMLRAIVLPEGVQKILPQVPPYRIKSIDLTALSEEQQAKSLDVVRDRMSHQVLPSDQWPLFELAASVLPGDKTRLHISLDCLITDARSFQIISGELVAFYREPDSDLPAPSLWFRDYVNAEKRLQDSNFYQRALNYWKERIKTLPPMPQLPLANAPESLKNHRFVQREGKLTPTEWQRLQARASLAGITPTAVLLQCFGETLAAWSRNPRMTLNLTLFNRLPLHPEVDQIVGDFTSLVMVGIDELSDGRFEERAQRLQKELWQGVDNRFVSGVRVLREIAQMGQKIQPMMPVVFTSTLGIGAGGQDSSSWHHLGEQVYAVSQTPQVWIDHVASEREDALYYTWDVVDELFPEGFIDELFAAYQQHLMRLATDESSWQRGWPDALKNLFPDHQRQLLEQINDTAGPEPAERLHIGFEQQADRQPDSAAVIAADRSLTYRELDQLSNQVAHRLRERKVNPNELIAVVMQKGWEQIVAVLGVLKAGSAYLPIDAQTPTDRLNYLLDHGQVKNVITQVCQDGAIKWPDGITRIRIGDEDLSGASQERLDSLPLLDDLAYVIFTSGSTGQPKGVMIDHHGAVNTINDINKRFEVGPDDRVLALSSLSFDLSVYDVFGVLSGGGAIVMPDAAGTRNPAHWAELISEHRVTVWNSVPALMDLLTDYAEQQNPQMLKSLRLVMMSGDWIPVRLPNRVRALNADTEIVSLGGATEASIWSILFPIGEVDEEWRSIPYGQPMVNQTFYVLNQELSPCPTWVPGELFIGGIGLAKGYWRDDEKTNASFITHPRTGERLYRTGDLGRYLPDGNIEFLGREDFQVKVQGYRVELGEIETVLETHPGVGNSVVVATGLEHGDKRLTAYYIADGETPATAEALRTHLSSKLPEYMVPSSFVALTEIPLTANGKIDRQALPDAVIEETIRERVTPFDEPPDEHEIERHVKDLLCITTIETDANLLQLGATSIEMIRIANALDQHLGFRPRMDDFYREPTVGGLIKLYETSGATLARPASDADDPLRTPEGLLLGTDKVLDPDSRNEFKAQHHGLRRFGNDQGAVKLSDETLYSEEEYSAKRSYRSFSETPVPLKDFSQLLSSMRAIELNGQPKYAYASAGGLYPVQLYVYLKPDRVASIGGGTYYYHPTEHRLIHLREDSPAIRDLYDPLINRPIFDEAAFGLFLAVQMNAIAPMYRERSLHYSVLEAGHMTQILESEGPRHGIGLCQIGGLETADFSDLLDLDQGHVLLHALLGGTIDETKEKQIAAADQRSDSDDDEERDEGEL